MSDGESSTGFTEFKDNFATKETVVNIPQSVKIHSAAAPPKKDQNGFEIPQNPHSSWSFDWMMFYLAQTRVMVMIVLTLFFLSLCLAIYVIGSPTHHQAVVLCPQWSAIIPAATERCPSSLVQLYYPAGMIEMGDSFDTSSNVQNAPLAVFLPKASSQYYYTLLVLDLDAAGGKTPIRIIGIATNLKLAESANLSELSWLTQYIDPKPTNSGIHRIAFLVYRHSQQFHGNQPVTRNSFVVDEWFKSEWSTSVELVGANYFRIRNVQ